LLNNGWNSNKFESELSEDNFERFYLDVDESKVCLVYPIANTNNYQEETVFLFGSDFKDCTT
jgi:hypothetical protein